MLLDKLIAVLRRDLLTALRYRAGFWLYVLGLLAELAGFFYLARAIGPGFRPDGVEYYPFLLIGTALYGFLFAGVNACVSTIHDAQVTGTMEVLMTTSTPAPLLMFLSVFSTFALRTLDLFFYVAAGFLLFGVSPQGMNVVGGLLVYLFTLAIALSFGVLAATIQVAVQKGRGAVVLLASAGGFLSGMAFPVSSLPRSLQDLAALFPLTHSLRAMRMALLQGASLSEMGEPLAVLALFSVLLLPASLLLFARALRHARLQGTLSFY